MKISVIGTGSVAQALIKGLISEKYNLVVGSRNFENESKNTKELRNVYNTIKIVSYIEAVELGEIIIFSIPGFALLETIKDIGIKKLEGKIVWDITNPFSSDTPVNGVIKLISSPEESLSENVQKLIPLSHVVKAMNTIGAHLMYKPSLKEIGTAFIAGNNEQAKEKVSRIVKSLGWDSYDAGKIESSRALEYMGQLYVAQGIFYNNWNTTFKYIV
jgi:8-hydroxy-5-deazaflavin:NADPH oxidoreductase